MYEDDYYEDEWAEREGEELSETTVNRFAISEYDEPYDDSDFAGWDRFDWGYGRDGWKVLVGKNDGIRLRACIVSPDYIVCSGWFPVDSRGDVEHRIIEAEGLMAESGC